MEDWSPAEDARQAVSGMLRHITQEVGTWHLRVRFAKFPYIVMHGEVRLRGTKKGELLLSIETPPLPIEELD